MNKGTDRLIPFLKQEAIQTLVRGLGNQINLAYKPILAPNEDLLFVITLKGALFFGADLLRTLEFGARLDFVRLSSYGTGTRSSGSVRFLKDLEVSPNDQHVLIVDEIVDSGRTLHFLREHIQASNPKSLRICSLLSKPSRRELEVPVDYLGREVEDKFLVGYGLDFAERYRNLPDIFELVKG